MARAPSPLDVQVLELLTGGFVLKTHEVAAGCGERMTPYGLRRYHSPDVRPSLERLARRGEVQKLRLPGDCWVYWRGPGAEW